MIIVWGIRHFRKNLGFKGQKMTCPRCGKNYKRVYIKHPHYIHMMWIPLIPIGSEYYSYCPICFYGHQIKDDKLAKYEIKNPSPENQILNYKAVHYKATDRFDLYIIDGETQERFDILLNSSRKEYKTILKKRCIKSSVIEMETYD